MTIDPSRLRRAIFLDAVYVGPGQRWFVSGGSASHHVNLDAVNGARCDCLDHTTRGVACKHILICRLLDGDPETVRALRSVVAVRFRRRERRAPWRQ